MPSARSIRGRTRRAFAARCAAGGPEAGIGALSRELYGDREGSHATPSEVAVTQYAFPDSIKSARMDPQVAPRGTFYDADDYRRRFADGRIGSDPSLATPEHGKRFYDTAVREVSEDYRKFIAADPVGV